MTTSEILPPVKYVMAKRACWYSSGNCWQVYIMLCGVGMSCFFRILCLLHCLPKVLVWFWVVSIVTYGNMTNYINFSEKNTIFDRDTICHVCNVRNVYDICNVYNVYNICNVYNVYNICNVYNVYKYNLYDTMRKSLPRIKNWLSCCSYLRTYFIIR